MMNKSERARMVKHALTLMRFYKIFKEESSKDAWKNLAERQAYRDSLESLKKTEFIKEYNLETYTVTFPDNSTIQA